MGRVHAGGRRGGGGGKLLTLFALLNSYHAELESDLAGQGIDLLDFWRGRITLRRLHVLIEGLPISSLFWSAAAGHRERWGPAEYLAAHIIDTVMYANFKDPKPHPRPGEAERAAARTTARAQRWMDRQAKAKGRGRS